MILLFKMQCPTQFALDFAPPLSLLQIHSIHQRRKVLGRSKKFDQLVAELKTKVREKGAQSLEGGSSSSGRSPSPEAPREQDGAPHCRRFLASLPAFRLALLKQSKECIVLGLGIFFPPAPKIKAVTM